MSDKGFHFCGLPQAGGMDQPSEVTAAGGADEAVEQLWQRCYEWHRRQGTAKLPLAASSSRESLAEALGDSRLQSYLAAAWERMRQCDLGLVDPAAKTSTAEEAAAIDAQRAWEGLALPWSVHLDDDAIEAFQALPACQATQILGRLLMLTLDVWQSAELLAEEGDYARVYETQCSGNVQLIWGPCLLRKVSQENPRRHGTRCADEGLTTLQQVLRVYAVASHGQQQQKRRAAAAFLAKSPRAQFPWHVFGPPLDTQLGCPGARHNLQLRLAPELDDRPRARPGLALLDGGELQRAVAPEIVRQFLEIVGGDRLTSEEKTTGSAHGNCLVVGRSGTGKTTVAMLRLAAFELLRSPGAVRPQSIFMTASPVLSHEVLR